MLAKLMSNAKVPALTLEIIIRLQCGTMAMQICVFDIPMFWCKTLFGSDLVAGIQGQSCFQQSGITLLRTNVGKPTSTIHPTQNNPWLAWLKITSNIYPAQEQLGTCMAEHYLYHSSQTETTYDLHGDLPRLKDLKAQKQEVWLSNFSKNRACAPFSCQHCLYYSHFGDWRSENLISAQ